MVIKYSKATPNDRERFQRIGEPEARLPAVILRIEISGTNVGEWPGRRIGIRGRGRLNKRNWNEITRFNQPRLLLGSQGMSRCRAVGIPSGYLAVLVSGRRHVIVPHAILDRKFL